MEKDVEAYAREKGISVMAAQKQLDVKNKVAKKSATKQVEPPAEEELKTNVEE